MKLIQWIQRSTLSLVALLVASLCVIPALAQIKPERTDLGGTAKSILWVGNSFFYYNNSMHNVFGSIAREAMPGQNVRGVSVTISGSGLDWHDMDSLLRPDGIGRYSFVGDNEIRINPAGKQFDAVIMMDCSQCPVHPQLKPVFHQFARKHSETIVRSGMQPVLFMSWAYKDKPAMTQPLADEYTKAGNDNNALVIPAGLAFARAISKAPDLELYQADKRHPSVAGTYLAACTSFAALYGKSPVGVRFDAGLGAERAAMLQQTAWETVQDYFKR